MNKNSQKTSLYTLPIRVYYEDTDAGGVVYYANYLKFMERARTEWLRDAGFEQDELRAQENIIFVVRSVNIEYFRPALFNQQLCVTVNVSEVGRTHITCQQQVLTINNALVAEATIVLVCVDALRFRPKRIPESILGVIK